jgi:hypothetical protein
LIDEVPLTFMATEQEAVHRVPGFDSQENDGGGIAEDSGVTHIRYIDQKRVVVVVATYSSPPDTVRVQRHQVYKSELGT